MVACYACGEPATGTRTIAWDDIRPACDYHSDAAATQRYQDWRTQGRRRQAIISDESVAQLGWAEGYAESEQGGDASSPYPEAPFADDPVYREAYQAGYKRHHQGLSNDFYPWWEHRNWVNGGGIGGGLRADGHQVHAVGEQVDSMKIEGRVLAKGQIVKIKGEQGSFRILWFTPSEGSAGSVTVAGGGKGYNTTRTFYVDRIGRRPRAENAEEGYSAFATKHEASDYIVYLHGEPVVGPIPSYDARQYLLDHGVDPVAGMRDSGFTVERIVGGRRRQAVPQKGDFPPAALMQMTQGQVEDQYRRGGVSQNEWEAYMHVWQTSVTRMSDLGAGYASPPTEPAVIALVEEMRSYLPPTTAKRVTAYTYTVTLDSGEYDSLGFIADRYTCGEYLWEHAEPTDDGGAVISLAEHEAWEYQELLKEENGNPDQVVPPLAGGSLADKLVDLYDSVV